MLEGSGASFESWREVDVSWNDTSIEQTEHTIFDIIFSNWWWFSKRIIPEVLWQDTLGKKHLVWSSGPNSKLFKLYIADSTL